MTGTLRDEGLYAALGDRFFGKYRGEVVSNNDSESRGRIQVRVPNVMGSQAIWALPCVAYAGPQEGLYALPPVGAKVWVEFEGGDTNFPIWVGGFWGSGEVHRADSDPAVKFLRTAGAVIRIDDNAGTVEIETGDGTKVTLGNGRMVLESTQIELNAGSGKLVLTSAGLDVNNGAFAVS